MKVLVTGATGFIGSYLAARLVQHGCHVRALVRPDGRAEHVRSLGCEPVRGDLRNEASLRSAVRGVNRVYHLGAAVGGCWEQYRAVTVEGTRRLLRLSLRAGVDRFIHVSSLAVYRMGDIPENAVIDESRQLEPSPERVGFYCRSKVEAERLVAGFQQRGLPIVVVRPGLVYGPRGNTFWPNVGFRRGAVCFVPGNLHAFVPFTHVENVVDALVLAGTVTAAVGGAYHIVDGNGLTRAEYLRRYSAATECRFRVMRVPLAALAGAMALARPLRRGKGRVPLPGLYALKSKFRGVRCDTAQAQWVLGWKPGVSLDAGLERTFAWQRDARGGQMIARPGVSA